MAGETPANLATPKYEGRPWWSFLIAGRFARGCSYSDIYW